MAKIMVLNMVCITLFCRLLSFILDKPTVTTTYTVTIDSATCQASGTLTITVLNCTGVKESKSSNASVEIFPNPLPRHQCRKVEF